MRSVSVAQVELKGLLVLILFEVLFQADAPANSLTVEDRSCSWFAGEIQEENSGSETREPYLQMSPLERSEKGSASSSRNSTGGARLVQKRSPCFNIYKE